MYIELQKPLDYSTGYSRPPLDLAGLSLVKSIVNGFKYHPYIFTLRQYTHGEPVYPYAHQLELLIYLFPRKPIRVLIGDEIGLGKTIEAIMIIKYLREVGLAKRILILVPRVLVHQWISELKRFGFQITEIFQIERETIQNILAKGFPEGVYAASVDLVKRKEYKDIILKVGWDAVIVDEAHRVGRVGDRETQRFELVSSFAKNAGINLVLLSATPHRGKPDDYIERLRLVDPYLFASVGELDSENFYRSINNALVFRRTKLDVNNVYEKRTIFTNCVFKARVTKASDIEVKFYSEVCEFLRSVLTRYYNIVGEKPSALGLLLVLIAKRASSSPKAALITLNRIIRRRAEILKTGEVAIEDISKDLDREVDEFVESILGSKGFEEYDEILGSRTTDIDEIVNSFSEKYAILLDEQDIKTLTELHRYAKRIIGDYDSRLASIVDIVQTHLDKGDTVVIFTEFRDTAEYIFDELKKRLSINLGAKVALVTSDRIEPPEELAKGLDKRKITIEDVKEWLAKGYVKVLVSTDVASEGLNLQHANIVIHYEPPWSPIKIVQRIGRVWRLGQRKDVVSYTVSLPVESDLKAFEVLYAKLLSWYVSGVEQRVPIGEELEIDMMGARAGGGDVDLLVLVPSASDRGEKIYFSEYRAWLEFIHRGGVGLEEYVRKILSMLQTLKRYAERIKLEEGEKEIRVRKILDDILGGLYGRDAEDSLRNILVAAAKLQGLSVEDRRDKMFIDSGRYVVAKNNISDVYKALESIIQEVSEPPDNLALLVLDKGIDIDELLLYKVELEIDGKPYYSEVVGVRRKGAEIGEVRGTHLLHLLTRILDSDKIIGIADGVQDDDVDILKNKISSKFKEIMRRTLNPFLNYVRSVEGSFSYPHSAWSPRDIAKDVREPRVVYIGKVLFLKTHEAYDAPPPIAVEEVEKKAMEVVMDYERRCGRIPVDVSRFEHYDIQSSDPVSGEARFIEVKGRSDNRIQVELTEVEFEYAKKLGESYWLYIVYNISSKPRLLIIRNPAKNIRWAEVGVKRYRLIGVENHAYTEGS